MGSPDPAERTLHQALEDAGFADAGWATARPQVCAGILGEVPLFSRLGKRDLKRVAGAAKIARIPAGQAMVREGFSAEGFYVLLTGDATVSRAGVAVKRLSRGDYFGELGLLDNAPRTASVTADADLWVMKLPRPEFFELLDRQPTIGRGLLEAMAANFRRVETADATGSPALT